MTYGNTESRVSDHSSLNTRSGRVTATVQSGYTSWMRYLGLALVTAVAVVILAANSQTTEANRSSDTAVPTQAPHWNGVYAKTFPGCVGAGSFIPARIVVVPREGAAHTMRYSDATVAQINATWNNDNHADDLYTVGKCAR